MTERERAQLTRLREAFSSEEWDPPSAECPESETLWASAAGQLGSTENEKVLLHVARCGQCASIWRLAREMVSPGEAAGEPVLPFHTSRRPRVWRRPAFVAAAATLLIGLGLGTGLLLQHRNVTPPPVYRHQPAAFNMVASPATEVLPRSRCRLRWSAGAPGTRYDLTVTGDDFSVLAVEKGLTAPEYLVPPDKIPKGTAQILWRVTAHLPDGTIVRSGTFSSRIEG